VRTSESKEH